MSERPGMMIECILSMIRDHQRHTGRKPEKITISKATWVLLLDDLRKSGCLYFDEQSKSYIPRPYVPGGVLPPSLFGVFVEVVDEDPDTLEWKPT